MVNANQEFKWNEKYINLAKELSAGTKPQVQIAEELDMAPETISRFKNHPEFMAKVNEFTIAHEQGTLAGLLRFAYAGLDIKKRYIEEDKTTAIDYAKLIADLMGHSKQKIEHSGIDNININIKRAEKKDE